MSSFDSLPLQRGRIVWAIKQSKSMTQASKIVGCSYDTFKKYAKQYDLFEQNKNQEGRGMTRKGYEEKNDPIANELGKRLGNVFLEDPHFRGRYDNIF